MTDTPSKVVLVSSVYSEPSLQRQISALARLVDVEVIAPEVAQILVFPEFRAADHCDGRFRPVRNIRLFGNQFLFRSRDLGLPDIRPDLIHIEYDPWTITFWQVRFTAWLFSRSSRVVVGSKKNTYRRYPGVLGSLKWRLGSWGLRSVDHVMCASEMNRAMLVRHFGVTASDTTVTTQVGVDTDQFRPVPAADRKGPLVVGYCGRMDQHKGVLDLIDAVAALRDTGVDVELRLLGGGPLDDMVRERAATSPWLVHLDPVPVDEVPAFLTSLDLYVLPARTLADHEEHDAHAMLQAMSCGVPVLATWSGIIPEILGDGAGIIVEANDVGALTDGLSTLLSDRDRRDRLAAAGRELVCARYSFDVVAGAKAAVYERVLAQVRRRGATTSRTRPTARNVRSTASR